MSHRSISATQLKQFRKKHNLGSNDSLSSKQFRELQLGSQSTAKGTPKEEAPFSFTYSIDIIENGYKITLTGKHLSKNVLNGSSFRRKLAYKKAIKKSMEEYRLQNLKFIKTLMPFTNASVSFTFFNRRSRDSDANGDTIKIFQDTFTLLGLIEDDTRGCLQCDAVDEVLQKEYKVIAILTKRGE